MEINFIEEKDNPNLNRKEIIIEIEHIKETTPSRKDIKEKLKALKDYNLDLTIIKKLENMYGLGKSKALIFVYENEEIMKKLEPKYLTEREVENQG